MLVRRYVIEAEISWTKKCLNHCVFIFVWHPDSHTYLKQLRGYLNLSVPVNDGEDGMYLTRKVWNGLWFNTTARAWGSRV